MEVGLGRSTVKMIEIGKLEVKNCLYTSLQRLHHLASFPMAFRTNLSLKAY